MAAHRLSIGSVQTLAELQDFPLFLDVKGVFSDEIEKACHISKSRFKGSLVLGVLEDMREVWITANDNPSLMQAKYKRVY